MVEGSIKWVDPDRVIYHGDYSSMVEYSWFDSIISHYARVRSILCLSGMK